MGKLKGWTLNRWGEDSDIYGVDFNGCHSKTITKVDALRAKGVDFWARKNLNELKSIEDIADLLLPFVMEHRKYHREKDGHRSVCKFCKLSGDDNAYWAKQKFRNGQNVQKWAENQNNHSEQDASSSDPDDGHNHRRHNNAGLTSLPTVTVADGNDDGAITRKCTTNIRYTGMSTKDALKVDEIICKTSRGEDLVRRLQSFQNKRRE